MQIAELSLPGYIIEYFRYNKVNRLFRFNTEDSEGVVMNENRATCIMPWVEAEGWVDLEVSLDGGPFYWKGQFFVGKETFWFTVFCTIS